MSPIFQNNYFTKLIRCRLTQIETAINKLFAKCSVPVNDNLPRAHPFGSLKNNNNTIGFDCARGVLLVDWFETTEASG